MSLFLQIACIGSLSLSVVAMAIVGVAALASMPLRPDAALPDPGEASLRADEHRYRLLPEPTSRVASGIVVHTFARDVAPFTNTIARHIEAGGGYVVKRTKHGSDRHLMLHVPRSVFRQVEMLADETGAHVNPTYRNWAQTHAGANSAGPVPADLVLVSVDVSARVFPTKMSADVAAACGYAMVGLILCAMFMGVMLHERNSKPTEPVAV